MKILETEVRLRRAEDEMVAEALRFAGIHVSSVYDLVQTRESYPGAIPVLLRLLPRVTHPAVQEGVVRALTVKEARGVAVDPLIREFKRIPFEGGERDSRQLLKWAIGNAIRVTMTSEDLGKVLDLVGEHRHGNARAELVRALGRFRSQQSVDALIEALADDRVARHSIVALRVLKAIDAIPHIRRYANHPLPSLRKAAREAVTRLQEVSASKEGRLLG